MLLNINIHKNMNEEDRCLFERRIEEIIHDVFISPADADYISARFFYLNRQQRAFFWPALQCLEKYLKANLLLLGLPVKKYGHKLLCLAKDLDQHIGVVRKIDLKPHPRHIEVFREISWRSTDPFDFLKTIEEYGAASNRYNYFGADIEFSTLLKLDQLVYALRQKIAPDMPLEGLNKGGSLKEFAFKENMPFAPIDYDHGSPCGVLFAGMSVPTIEIALKGLFGQQQHYKEWVSKNLQIREDELERLAQQT